MLETLPEINPLLINRVIWYLIVLNTLKCKIYIWESLLNQLLNISNPYYNNVQVANKA